MSKITVTNNGEPDTPATGRTVIYSDSTAKTLMSKDDTGAVLAYGDTKKFLISATDTTENYALAKLIAGGGVTITQTGTGGDETLVFSIDGPLTYQGGYNAATNTPDLDTSPSGISKGYTYTVTAAGTFFTVALEVGDLIMAEIDNPTVEADWTIVQKNETGVVSGSASSVDNEIVKFDGTTGKVIQGNTSGGPTISDVGAMTFNNDFSYLNNIKTSGSGKSVHIGKDAAFLNAALSVNSDAANAEILNLRHSGSGRFAFTTAGNFTIQSGGSAYGFLQYSHLSTSYYYKITHDASSNVLFNNNAKDYIWQVSGTEYLRLTNAGILQPKGQLQLAVGTTTLAPINFQTATSLKTTPQNGDIEFMDGHLFLTYGARHAIPTVAGIKTTTTTVVNTVTETEIFTYTFAVGELNADQRVNIIYDGVFSNSTSSDDFTIRFKVNGTTTHTLARVGGNATNEGWDINYRGTIRTAGVSGTYIDNAVYVDSSGRYSSASLTESSIDTTATVTVSITMQWDAAKAGNTFSATQGHIEFLH